jgi:glycosyltransferase involved in cell wall biosynthesis
MYLWNGLSSHPKKMSMPATKIVMDGTLFAECKMRGANRDGMMRVAEDIAAGLAFNDDLDISFASTVFVQKYDQALKDFVQENYPRQASNIISKRPPGLTNLLKWKQLFREKAIEKIITPYYKEIDNSSIFHSFYYPFSDAVQRNKVKKTITFLDIIPLRMNGYPSWLVNRTQAIVNSIASNYAISISAYSREDLLDYDKRIKPENVFVAPLAASKKLFFERKDRGSWEVVKEKYKLPDNYFLTVAGNDIRKNVPHIVKCFNKFILQENPKEVYLVLAGNASHSHSMLNDLNISKVVRDRIFIPDTYIDSTDLSVLYSNALSFFFMSLYEGFGLPALEAMQCGTPVVSSNVSSLPEVVGDAGIMLSPTDEDTLCEAMNELYKSETLRKEYSAAGLHRAALFSWERCAKEYADIFKKITDLT